MEEISIRSIQHFLFCPHRWGMIEIDRAWAENYFVARAEIVHKRAHSEQDYKIRSKRVYTSVKVWNDEYGIYGVTDCVEEENGRLSIVEYKPTMPKESTFREEDAMQVFAQKLCADQVFGCDCDALLYYADKRKRVKLPFDTEYEKYKDKLIKLLNQMRELRQEGKIPPVQKGQYCIGCSMKDICIPGAAKTRFNVRQKILESAREDV